MSFADLLYHLLKQRAVSLLITSLDNQLATSRLTTCNTLVVNKLSQLAMRTHRDIGLLLQDVARSQQTCCTSLVFGCAFSLQA